MLRAAPFLVLLSFVLLSGSGSAITADNCPANSHPGAEPESCVCDDGYHWSNGACVRDQASGPDPAPCRPACLLELD